MAARFDDELGGLSAPLLAPGSPEDGAARHSPAAAARVVARAPGRRAARRRRRRRSLRRSRQASDASGDASAAARAGGGDDGDDDESEAADGARAESGREESVPPSLAPGVVARAAAVALATGGGVVAYAASLALAATTVAASTAATTVLGVAGGVCALLAPLVLGSEWRLAKLPTLRGRLNSLRGEAERMRSLADFLAMEEEDLRQEAKDLEKANQNLVQIVKGQNAGNVEDLVELVLENQDILLEMKENLRQCLLQDVVKLVMQCDIDRSFKLRKKEAELLEARLQFALEIHGIVFDAEKFRRAVALSPSLVGAMTIVRRLLPDENDRVSSFWDVDTDEEEDGEGEDVYDMFYVPVEDEFRRGNSDSIQMASEYFERTGERPMVMSLSASMMKGAKGFRLSAMRSSTDASMLSSSSEL